MKLKVGLNFYLVLVLLTRTSLENIVTFAGELRECLFQVVKHLKFVRNEGLRLYFIKFLAIKKS